MSSSEWKPVHGSSQEVWDKIFNPVSTAWYKRREMYAQKREAAIVLFKESTYFHKQGLSVMRQFIAFASKLQESNCKLDNPTKIRDFLKYRVDQVQVTSRNIVEESMMNAFTTAVPHINSVSAWQGYNIKCCDCEQVIVLKTQLLQSLQAARLKTQDFASSSRYLTKRLHKHESDSVLRCWWDGSASEQIAQTTGGQEWAQVRGLLLYCLQKYCGRRGEDLRSIKLSMLFSHNIEHTKPVENAMVIGVSLRHVKECRENIEHLIGWTRAKDRWSCPIGALALYLVYMNDIHGPNIINLINRDMDDKTHNWRGVYLVQSKTGHKDTPLSYTAHNITCHGALDAAEIYNKTASTHMARTTLACELMERGVEINDVGMYQGWFHNTAADSYLRASFKTTPMLISHGWQGISGYECWWEGDDAQIPKECLNEVFPGLDELVKRLDQSSYTDHSLFQFLKCLVLLRKVFIQDAVYKRERYQSFPVYEKHPLFAKQTPWLRCIHNEQRMIEQRQVDYVSESQRLVIDAVKSAISEGLGLNPLNGSVSSKPQDADWLNKPPDDNKIPDIKDPEDLYSCYKYWTTTLRPYFERTSRPPWSQQFGTSAQVMKQRYCRIRPYFLYLDKVSEPWAIREAIDKLEAIRKCHSVTPSSFVKQCFYCLTHKVTASKPPPIHPSALRREMIESGLCLTYREQETDTCIDQVSS